MPEVNLYILGLIGFSGGFIVSIIYNSRWYYTCASAYPSGPIHIAIGSSLVMIVATYCTASATYMKNNLANVKPGLLLESTGVPGAIVGAGTAILVSSSLLNIIFIFILIYIAILYFLKKQKTIIPLNTI